MTSPPPLVHIHYLRPPDDERVHAQRLLLDADDVKVTLARDIALDSAVRVHGRPVLEPGADAVWFTFPGRWHDVGRFHTADGTFTGLYANVLTPPAFREGGAVWETTDLFLDLWIDPAGTLSVLDRAQLDRAVREERLEARLADRAREEVRSLQAAHRAGRWPPAVVHEWTRDRALTRMDEGDPRD